MNSENGISRKNFIKSVGIIGISSILASCNKTPEKTQSLLEETSQWLEKTADAIDKAQQRLNSSQTANAEKSSLTPPSKVASPTISQTAPHETTTPTSTYIKEDKENLQEIRNATGGEKLSLDDPLISYIVKIPRPFVSDAVYGVLAIKVDSEEKGVAIIENFNCGFELLSKADLLGNPIGSDKSPTISGLWKPDYRFNNIDGTMFVEPSLGTIAVVTGTSYQLKENESSVSCPKKSIFSNAGDFPEKLAQETGKLIRDIIEGFKDGYFEENK
jgi:hypothetical protein